MTVEQNWNTQDYRRNAHFVPRLGQPVLDLLDPRPGEKILEDYRRNAHFVPRLGRPVLDLLDPRPGERILDLGCGDGVLTREIMDAGANVLGIDSSHDMVEDARRRGVPAEVMDAARLPCLREFDAVFSNAVLHWIKDAGAVITGVAGSLKAGGRFVGEFGGHGNVAAIVTALAAVLERRGVDIDRINPWYYPTAEDYALLLEENITGPEWDGGFDVGYAALIPRPTPLPTGMEGWLVTFAGSFYQALPPSERDDAQFETVSLLRHSLCDERGNWMADYVRLRFEAILKV